MRVAFGALLFLVATMTTAFADEELCRRLQTFESAPFAHGADGKSQVRYLEMHWIGCWGDFDKGFHLSCRSSTDAAARDLCKWLPDNTSFEFATELPRAMLRCHGLEVGRWFPWVGEIARLIPSPDDRRIALEVDFQGRARCHHAMRIRVMPNSTPPQKLGSLIDSTVDPVTDASPTLDE